MRPTTEHTGSLVPGSLRSRTSGIPGRKGNLYPRHRSRAGWVRPDSTDGKDDTDTEFDPAGTRQTASLFTFVNAKKNSFKVTKNGLDRVRVPLRSP